MLTLLGAENVRSKPVTRIAPRDGLRARLGMVARQRAVQQLALDLAEDVELVGCRAHPLAGRLALAGVVILDALRDRLQVVVGLALSELADRQH
jgi:hypothetical protein